MDGRKLGFHISIGQVAVLCALLLPALVLARELPLDVLPEQGDLPGDSLQFQAVDDATGTGSGVQGVVPERVRRSSVVFRPLFASREREAERIKRNEERRRYWESERRRQAQARG